MGISVRKSIGWPPEPHSEPTSTIVLTSPKCWFVDVRVLSPAATDSGHVVDIDWAFAGMSSSTGVRSVWRHWVDSRTENAASVTDEGDCEELPDGNYLEKGEMVNPATGKMAPYEEVWIDVQPVATSPSEVGAMRCVVVQLHDDAAGTRGVVERLGQFCQGIVRTAAKGITVERWQWTADKGWQRTFRLGTGSIPCQQLVHETRLLEEGDILHDNGHLWTVIETAAVRGGGH
ncbi:hypothetical protein CMQ_3922 [Grosmannia clavigera kw1407]|uniref:Protein HRI1 n=1 Tax=Grosmannia clavigera (strain kw1407 / UAMH 11150) TaxID=655863 RepID=F0X8N8_GROCL|nr:uncharacterized protein CMQ_3922 [Grosmannia clavigera kw1407]EFX05853.1 hypothetical protein CMQ_3922 [Grosmannia clavigera kw1407]